MIKIGFKDVGKARKDYPDLIAEKIVKRLTILRTSLVHISVAPNAQDDHLVSFQAVTQKIINHFQPTNSKISVKRFYKIEYDKTVSDYVSDPLNLAKLTAINFTGLIQLLDRLLANNEKVLRMLLVCSPDRLYKINDLLMHGYGLKSDANKFVLNLGFDWKLHNEISDEIKSFFHNERQVVHCPYCNINRAFYSKLDSGEVSSSFSLDHFYHKAESPLLTFCLFNLVPADDICNGANIKGQIPFSYDYHLNPYQSGMDRTRMIFRPKLPQIGEDPTEIELRLIPPAHERRYQQLVGNFPDINETRKFGNINVFKLKKNYNEDFVLERAGGVQRKCESLFRSRQSLTTFLKEMKMTLNVTAYQRFYKDEFGTEFFPENFHRYCYSKLVRDIHDNVLERDQTNTNDDIKTLIIAHPA